MAKAQRQQAEYANRSRKDVEFQRGDKVLLSTKNLSRRTDDGKRKFDMLWAGPFDVTERVGKVSYRLALPPDMRLPDVFHVSLLREYKESSTFKGREIPRVTTYVPEYAEKHRWYVVSKLLDSRKRGRTVQYKVRWEGYEQPEYDTWEPAQTLRRDLGNQTFTALVQAFEQERSTQPQQQQEQPPAQPRESRRRRQLGPSS